MPPQWVLPAEPCAICYALSGPHRSAFTIPHTCSRTLTRAAIALTVAKPDTVTVAYSCAFTRALRDA